MDRRRDGVSDPLDLYRARYADTQGAEPLARLQDLDLGIYLVDDLLVKTDRASMAHSLEARVPFLDPVVAELALALPSTLKVRGFAKKRLLRQAVAPLLPRSIVRGRKQGFSIPLAAWLRGELEPFAREILAAETLRRHGLLSPEPVQRLLDDHVARREDLSRQIWGLMTLTLWMERYGRVPGGAPPMLIEGRPSALDALFAFAVALVLSWLLVPLTERVARRVGAIDYPRQRSLHQIPTPKLGGLAILGGVMVAMLLFLPWVSATRALIAGAVSSPLSAWLTTYSSWRAAPKLLGQTVAAMFPVFAGVAVSDFTLPFLGRVSLDHVLFHNLALLGNVKVGHLLTIVGFVAVMNVINFIDGVDGLAAGVCVIASATFAVIALSLNRTGAGVLAALTAGGALGFLRHGFPPAASFMGDTGSNLLGYLLAAVAVLGSLKTNAVVALFFPLCRPCGADPGLGLRDRQAASSTGGRSTRPIAPTSITAWRTSASRSAARWLYLYGWALVLAALALALRFVPYSDNHGHFDPLWTAVMVACGVAAVAASVYLLLALEILKLRVSRFRQLVGPGVPAAGPGGGRCRASRASSRPAPSPPLTPRPGEFVAIDPRQLNGRSTRAVPIGH